MISIKMRQDYEVDALDVPFSQFVSDERNALPVSTPTPSVNKNVSSLPVWSINDYERCRSVLL
jgi:hypothetical protein